MTLAQTWNPDRYRRNGGFVAAYGADVAALLSPQPDEIILDVGCGDGTLSRSLMECGATVIGIDSSPEQVAAARERGVDARCQDVCTMTDDNRFDAVFSNAALHWVTEPDQAVRRIFAALKPGGRFVGEMGGKGNVTLVSRAILGALTARGLRGLSAWPWFFPGETTYSAILRDAGFIDVTTSLFERPTPLPGRFADWVETFAQPFLGLVAPSERPAFLNEVEALASEDLMRDDGIWFADYVRLRFSAGKPEDGA